ncbi:MAG: peptide ABC transporter substrate-binding protein [Clostridia bacterium]|nr:peptide ABC transporter substrate-binding protein [Clostridia bacterium]
MKKIITMLVVMVMLTLTLSGLAACTGGGKKTEQKLTICVGPDPETMDPALNSSVDGSIYLTNLFSGLYGYDKNLNIVPECAKEVVAPTALTGADEGKYQYVITLKDGLKWSDGQAMKASDFEYAWKRAADPETGADYQYIFDVIDGYSDDDTCDLNVTADDTAGTITIVTSSYCSYFNQLLAFPTYYPVRQDIVSADANWATKVSSYVSNGPFKMSEWTVGSEMVFVKNPEYFDAANVKLESITAVLSDDDDAIYANYTNGTIQYTTNVPVAQIPVLKADSNRMNKDFFIGDYIGTYYLELNVEYSFKPGLTTADSSAAAWEGWDAAKNAEVRHALSLLIDRNYIVNEVTAGGQLPAYGFIPAGMDDGDGHEFRKEADAWWSVDAAEYESNCAQAVKMLKKYYDYDDATGKFTNFPKFEYSINRTSGNLAICAAIKDMWDDYGIDASVDQRDWATIQQALTAGDFTLSRLGWIADYNDPVNFLEIYLSVSGNNHPRLGKTASKDGAVSVGTQSVYGPDGSSSWAEFDALIAQIKTEANTATRANYMYTAEEWIRDTYTILPLYYYTNPYLAKENVKDYIYSPLGWVSYKFASIA